MAQSERAFWNLNSKRFPGGQDELVDISKGEIDSIHIKNHFISYGAITL